MNLEHLAKQIRAGHRRALARGLTLVESQLPQHERLALGLFEALGSSPRAFRLGVTGPPGAGKSTLVERIVTQWVQEGERVAVLAVDPSSQRTGGSLLGDKTRMGEISDRPEVFIRPSPTGEHLGGLGRRTPLMCALFERAGYSKVVVETVGVGQSEIAASYLVDLLLLVALPGAGDEVQGIKRGLMEEVDLVAVNKADLGQAKSTVAILRSALRVFRREVAVLAVSAQEGTGLEALMEKLSHAEAKSLGDRTRGELHFFDQFFLESLKRRLHQEGTRWAALRCAVERGEIDFLGALPELTRQLDEALARMEPDGGGEPSIPKHPDRTSQ